MTKEYRLSVDPRILELLGPSLYTNIYYVLAELIANAYDADAHNVYIIAKKDEIRVEDDGHGMSYNAGDVERFLNVAAVSRSSEDESFTRSGLRRKMGRKGVGKLAALSVSEEVDILTIAGTERSGFVLARHPETGNLLRPIPDEDVTFEKVQDHGSAIVMRQPQYRLYKDLDAVRRNLLRLFPLVDSEFRVHVIRGSESVIVEAFDENIMRELGTLITLGVDFEGLGSLVPDLFPERRSDLVQTRAAVTFPLPMRDVAGVEHEYTLEVRGWIGTYRSTRGRKVDITDFPDNFISLFANNKLGEFNILPVVGQNKLNEVYVVGQLHVDLFELTELPDIALSNRQGYKSDDPRYEAVREHIRNHLLADALRMRELFADLGKAKKKGEQERRQRENEANLRKAVDGFRRHASEDAARAILGLGAGLSQESVEAAVAESINENSPDLGLKSIVDEQKKKLLISQTYPDKALADVIYQMLSYNGIPAEDVLYTNCDDEVCRVPEGRKVYDYLREFFVESYSTKKIYVLFVTSDNTKISWGALTEVGAAWITQVDHEIFNIRPFRPEHPLDDERQWQSTSRDEASSEIWVNRINADILCSKIERVCDALGHKKKTRAENVAYLATLVEIRAT